MKGRKLLKTEELVELKDLDEKMSYIYFLQFRDVWFTDTEAWGDTTYLLWIKKILHWKINVEEYGKLAH